MFLAKKPEQPIKPPDGRQLRATRREQIIEQFVQPRAFTGPRSPAEIDGLMKLFDRAAGQGRGYVNSVRLMLKAVLVSPKFLYRIEQDNASATEANGARRVSDLELATRLSYFIWSSMPGRRADRDSRRRTSSRLTGTS